MSDAADDAWERRCTCEASASLRRNRLEEAARRAAERTAARAAAAAAKRRARAGDDIATAFVEERTARGLDTQPLVRRWAPAAYDASQGCLFTRPLRYARFFAGAGADVWGEVVRIRSRSRDDSPDQDG